MWGTKHPARISFSALPRLNPWLDVRRNLGDIYIQLPVWLLGHSWRKLQLVIWADLLPKKVTDAAKSFKSDMRKTRQQHHTRKIHIGHFCGEVGRTLPANKLTTDTGWKEEGGGEISGSENCRSLPSRAKVSVQNERSKQKAGEEEKIIGRESSRCVSGCSPATRSRQEHHFQFLNSSQQTVIPWHISPRSALSFFPHLFWLAADPAYLSQKRSPFVTKKNSHYYNLLLLLPSLFKGVGSKTLWPGNSPFVMSQKALLPFPQ